MYFIVVKRGDFRRQEVLHKSFGSVTPVVWDRRVRQRRHPESKMEGQDRRKGDRRSSPPPSWQALGFVVVSRSV
jgi:hypothetical protein